MFDETTYASYKRDTRRLIHWIVNTSNKIICQLSSNKAENFEVNTSGKITVSGLLRLAELIGQFVKEKNGEEKGANGGTAVPGTVLKLIEKVLEARKAAHSFFEQIAQQFPDPSISKSNATHKFFIDALSKTFDIFGGQEWIRRSKENTQSTASDRSLSQFDPDIIEEGILFSNQFSGLNIDNDDHDGEEDEEPERSYPTKSTSSRQKKNKKGKKTKPGKKSQNTAPDNTVSLDSCCIVDDEGKMSYDYLMAAYSLLFQMEEYRHYVQGLWREVAYGGYNGAVAATVSKIAIALVKQSEISIFVDFPGHDSYGAILAAVTNGNAERSVADHPGPIGGDVMDFKEHLFLYAYRDLLDFIQDFQKNCNGKPTKRMMKETRDWDPNFNLQTATKEQRLAWRRVYTINWLYDLLNNFLNIRLNMQWHGGGKILAIGDTDWAKDLPFHPTNMGCIFGVKEFARTIMSLATKKPNLDIRPRISPHTVLQLQFMVDSWTVSRGWTASTVKVHLLYPPTTTYITMREIDLFLDREGTNKGYGYLDSLEGVMGLFYDEPRHGDDRDELSKDRIRFLTDLRARVQGSLGKVCEESPALDGDLPFRFSNKNGLWEHSPFLCGAGLAEALTLAHVVGMRDWEVRPELMCIMHIHNMLQKRGYLPSEFHDVYLFLGHSMSRDFFHGHFEFPDKDFAGCLQTKIAPIFNSAGRNRLRSNLVASRRMGNDQGLHEHLLRRLFKTKSFLQMYQDADWDLSRIPEEDIPLFTNLFNIRIHRSPLDIDPKTNLGSMADCTLKRRAMAAGVSECRLFHMIGTANAWRPEPSTTASPIELPSTDTPFIAPEFSKYNLGSFLRQVEVDIVRDICSFCNPHSSFNPNTVLIMARRTFSLMEERLQTICRDEDEPLRFRGKGKTGLGLAYDILRCEDDKVLKIVAGCFKDEQTSSMFVDHYYWDYIHDEPLAKVKERIVDPVREIVGPACTVM